MADKNVNSEQDNAYIASLLSKLRESLGQTEPTSAVTSEPSPDAAAEPGTEETVAADAPTEAPTELTTSTPEAAATPEATATPDLSQVKAFLVVTVGDKTYQPIPLTEEGYYRLRHGDCINIVHVTPTSIDMHEANCDNQDCVEQGEVTLENKDTRILGNMIICLPNQVTLQLYSRDELMDWLTTVQEDAANE